ncbi:hypothetical protein HY450_02885 [Candidatus Pacearchaeota archaeon]|nr:hypothetical protein [Candidatus Pacearchaeota archaeon]
MKKTLLVLIISLAVLFGIMSFISWKNPYAVHEDEKNEPNGFIVRVLPLLSGVLIVFVVALLSLVITRDVGNQRSFPVFIS